MTAYETFVSFIKVYQKIIHNPGAGYISLHFSKFDLAPGDYVEISSGDDTVVHSYRGKGKVVRRGNAVKSISNFWAAHIPGDTAVIKIYSKNPKSNFGFVIDKYVRGYERQIIDALMEDEADSSEGEAICTNDDKQWAKCHDGTTMYDKSKAVCRLLINGSSACTGWLLGSQGHIMTNNHCISTQSAADNTDYEFMAEGATCTSDCSGWFSCAGTVAATSGTMVKTSSSLDYTLILLPTNLTGTYGYMQLRNALPSVGERIYIPQHPGGKGKQIAVNSDIDAGYCQVYSTNEAPCMGGPGDIGYYADTEGGSSGSPVLAYSDHLVVALHHCANCPNRGVPIPAIVTDLGSSIPANAIGSGTIPDPVDLDEAVDNTTLTFTTGGSADWDGDESTYYYDNDSAVSGTITHNQYSYMQTTVNYSTAKNVSFYWKVSSEGNYDFLKFYIDGVQQDSISGTVDWAQKTYALTSGSHTLKWEYSKDGSVSNGSDKGWVDKVVISDGGVTPTDTLEAGVDNTSISMTTSGNGTWAYNTADYQYDNDSIKSPAITHSQSASVETVISGVTSVKFYWKVSSESGYDYLRFYIDGTLQDQISGATSWAQKTYSVSSGSHTLKWTYYKDGSVSSGSDCGWVDKLELGTGGGTIDTLEEAIDNASVSVTTSGDANWLIDSANFYYNNASIKNDTITHNQSASAQVTVSGVTSVKFYWKASSETNYDYLKFYIDGVLKDQISGTTSWAQKTYTVTSGSHTLKWTYSKDSSVSSGSDCGWVDKLELQ